MASTAAPDWTSALRKRGQEAFQSLPTPVQKDKGWEFTDVSKLDLDAWRWSDDGNLDASPARAPVVDANGGPGVLQVDGAFDAPRRGAGRHRRLHARGCGRRASRAGRALPRVPADGPRQVHGAEHRRVARRHVRLRARGRARRAADRHVGAARLGVGAPLALADRGRGGRRGDPRRAVGVERRRPRGLLQPGHRADRRRRRERRVPVRAGPLRARLDPRQPAHPGRARTRTCTGSDWDSGPARASCAWRPTSTARARPRA